jgi:hypothetical protein
VGALGIPARILAANAGAEIVLGAHFGRDGFHGSGFALGRIPAKSPGRIGARQPFHDDLLQGLVAAAEALVRVEYFEPGQTAGAVLIGGEAFGQVDGGCRAVEEHDAQSIDFGVVGDFQGGSKIFSFGENQV